MDAGLLDVLHDPADPDVLAVADRVDVDLDRVLEEAVEEDLALAACVRSQVVGEHRRRRRRAPSRGRRARSSGARAAGSRRAGRRPAPPRASCASAYGGAFSPSRSSSAPKRPRSSARSIASGWVPSSVTPARLQPGGEPQRRLAAELDDHALGLLDLDDRQHVLERQRLEVQPVGRVVVGRDRLRVAVDHHRVAAGLAHGHRRVHAAVVELDALADPVRAGAEDHHARPVAAPDLARARVALPGRVVVRRLGLELGRAGVDGLVGARTPVERASSSRRSSRRNHGSMPVRARISPSRDAAPLQLEHQVEAVGARATRSRVSSSSSGRRASAGRRARASASPCAKAWPNVRPIAITSPTDFMCVESVASTPGNFSNANRGHLTTT